MHHAITDPDDASLCELNQKGTIPGNNAADHFQGPLTLLLLQTNDQSLMWHSQTFVQLWINSTHPKKALCNPLDTLLTYKDSPSKVLDYANIQ